MENFGFKMPSNASTAEWFIECVTVNHSAVGKCHQFVHGHVHHHYLSLPSGSRKNRFL
jgi:hypothetical protein